MLTIQADGFIHFGLHRARNDLFDRVFHRDDMAAALFGQVTQGMDIVDQIADLPTKPYRQLGNEPGPVEPVVIESAIIIA